MAKGQLNKKPKVLKKWCQIYFCKNAVNSKKLSVVIPSRFAHMLLKHFPQHHNYVVTLPSEVEYI